MRFPKAYTSHQQGAHCLCHSIGLICPTMTFGSGQTEMVLHCTGTTHDTGRQYTLTPLPTLRHFAPLRVARATGHLTGRLQQPMRRSRHSSRQPARQPPTPSFSGMLSAPEIRSPMGLRPTPYPTLPTRRPRWRGASDIIRTLAILLAKGLAMTSAEPRIK